MGSFSIWHWLIVLLVVVLIFGTKKLRNIGQDLGGAVKGFKDGMKSRGRPTGGERRDRRRRSAGQTIEGEVRKETRTRRERVARASAVSRELVRASLVRSVPPGARRDALPLTLDVRHRLHRDHGHRRRRADRDRPRAAAEGRAHARPPLRPHAALRQRRQGRHQPRDGARRAEEAADEQCRTRRAIFETVGRRASAQRHRVASIGRRSRRQPIQRRAAGTRRARRRAASCRAAGTRAGRRSPRAQPRRCEADANAPRQAPTLPGFDRDERPVRDAMRRRTEARARKPSSRT